MTDVVPVPAYKPSPPPENADLAFFPNEETSAPSLAQEINARRSQIENPELLRRLRGL